MKFSALLVLMLSLGFVANGAEPTGSTREKTEPQRIVWSAARNASFVMVYVLGQPGPGDSRPAHKSDPLAEPGGSRDLGPRIISDGRVDVAALVGLTRERARLNDAQRGELVRAVFQSDRKSPVMESYEPHHAVVFYDDAGHPLGVIEISLSSHAVRLTDGRGLSVGRSGVTYEPVDFAALAKLFKDLGLGLGPEFESLDAYCESLERVGKQAGEVSQPAGTR